MTDDARVEERWRGCCCDDLVGVFRVNEAVLDGDLKVSDVITGRFRL